MFQFFSIFGLHTMTKNLKNSSKMIVNTILALARVLFCTILALKIRQRRHISQCSHFRDNPNIKNTSKHVRNGLEDFFGRFWYFKRVLSFPDKYLVLFCSLASILHKFSLEFSPEKRGTPMSVLYSVPCISVVILLRY